MKTWLSTSILVSCLATASIASADSIGPCPAGEIVVVNPTAPGSMHHGGFHCEPDPNASHGCSVSFAPRGSPAAAGWLLGLGLVAAWRRRSR